MSHRSAANRQERQERANAAEVEISRLKTYLTEIKKLASDPFASETVALRACLLAANEALGFPGPEPSPERDLAKAIIREAQADLIDDPNFDPKGDDELSV